MIWRIPRPPAVAEGESDKRVELWLQNRGFAVSGVSVGRTTVIIDADRDPTTALAVYDSQPTPAELAHVSLRRAIQDIRAIPAASRTPEQRAWLAWAVIQRFD